MTSFKDSIKRKFARIPPQISTFPSLSPISSPPSPLSTPRCSYSFSVHTPETAHSDFSVDLSALLGSAKAKGPKIKPYIYTQAQSPPQNRHVGHSKCFVCDEFIHTKLFAERVIVLRCGDSLHEQCFNVSVDYKLEKLFKSGDFTANKASLAALILPKCKGTQCIARGVCDRIDPQDPLFIDSVLNEAIAKSIEFDKLQLRNLSTPSFVSTPSKLASSTHIDTPFHLRRESAASFISSVRSPSPNPTILTYNSESFQIDTLQVKSNAKLKNDLLQNLLNYGAKMDLTSLVSLGDLKLVDKLSVSYENFSWSAKMCYLFSRSLVILGDASHQVYDLDDFKLTTLKSGLSLNLGQSQVYLNSDTSSILEKWAVGLSDPTFVFPPHLLSGTINSVSDITIGKCSSESTLSFLESPTPRRLQPPIAFDKPLKIQDDLFVDDESDVDSDQDYIKSILQNKTSVNMDHSKVDQLYMKNRENIQRQSLELTLDSKWSDLIENIAREIHK